MKASVAIQVLPGVEKDKICPIVDKCIEYIKAQGLKTFVSPFETTTPIGYPPLLRVDT